MVLEPYSKDLAENDEEEIVVKSTRKKKKKKKEKKISSLKTTLDLKNESSNEEHTPSSVDFDKASKNTPSSPAITNGSVTPTNSDTSFASPLGPLVKELKGNKSIFDNLPESSFMFQTEPATMKKKTEPEDLLDAFDDAAASKDVDEEPSPVSESREVKLEKTSGNDIGGLKLLPKFGWSEGASIQKSLFKEEEIVEPVVETKDATPIEEATTTVQSNETQEKVEDVVEEKHVEETVTVSEEVQEQVSVEEEESIEKDIVDDVKQDIVTIETEQNIVEDVPTAESVENIVEEQNNVVEDVPVEPAVTTESKETSPTEEQEQNNVEEDVPTSVEPAVITEKKETSPTEVPSEVTKEEVQETPGELTIQEQPQPLPKENEETVEPETSEKPEEPQPTPKDEEPEPIENSDEQPAENEDETIDTNSEFLTSPQITVTPTTNALHNLGENLDLKTHCTTILSTLMTHKYSSHFNNPVNEKMSDFADYRKFVKNPMDFSTVKKKLEEGIYVNLSEFIIDLQLVFENTYIYHLESSPQVKMAQVLQDLMEKELDSRVPTWRALELSPKVETDHRNQTSSHTKPNQPVPKYCRY